MLLILLLSFIFQLAVWDDTTTGNDTTNISTHTHTHTHTGRERETIAIAIAKNKTTAQPTAVINRWYIIFSVLSFLDLHTSYPQCTAVSQS